MAFQRLIKRTVWVAKCDKDDWKDVRLVNTGLREVMCPICHDWCQFKEESYTGPEDYSEV